jgi:hypothetical protein
VRTSRGRRWARGPFKVVSWTSGKVDTQRFEDYWGKDDAGRPLPYLDQVIIRFVPSAAVRLVELESGGRPIGRFVSDKDFEKVTSSPVMHLVDTHLGVTHFVNCNNGRPPFDNLNSARRYPSLSTGRPGEGDLGGTWARSWEASCRPRHGPPTTASSRRPMI